MMLYCLSCDYHGIESTTGPSFSNCPQCHGTAWSNDPNRVIRGAGDRPPAPSDVVMKIEAALQEVAAISRGDHKWRMRVPVDPEDSDEVITHALLAARDALGAVRPTPRAAPTLKETLREMYEQEFYQAGDKDYEVWLDRVVAWLAPRLASPVSLGAPTPAMIAAAQRVIDECAQGSSGHGAPSLGAIEALRAALTAQEPPPAEPL